MSEKIVKFLTSGSVDDGKSTLIGRLLFDTNSLYADQIQEIRKLSEGEEIDYSLFIEGLESERKQKITIDVAYRYFSDVDTKFIIADAPGHEEYTRNMAVAAANSDVAVLLIDAKGGIKTQTLRHFYVSYLFGIRNFILAINKMDLVSYAETRFAEISTEFKQKIKKFYSGIDINFIPVVAKDGDNIVEKGSKIKWYKGDSLLDLLRNSKIKKRVNNQSRFPVQNVYKYADERHYMGWLSEGSLEVGDKINIYPSQNEAVIKKILIAGREDSKIVTGKSATIILDRDCDIDRGSVFTKSEMHFSNKLTADLIWFAKKDFSYSEAQDYLIRLNNNYSSVQITKVNFLRKANDFTNHKTNSFGQNDIVNVNLEVAKNLPFDFFKDNHFSGSFILIDKFTHETLACGLITQDLVEAEDEEVKIPNDFIKDLTGLIKKHFGAEQSEYFINQLK